MKCALGNIGKVMYATNEVDSRKAIIYVAGLGDIFVSKSAEILMDYATEKNMFFVAVNTRSMPHYGTHQIEDDVEDIDSIYRHFRLAAYSKVWMLGHSTGCQILTAYSEISGGNTSFILQGPISDREYEEKIDKKIKDKLAVAEKTAGKEETDILPFKHNGEYITAKRYLDLFARGGREDFFSLEQKVSHLNKHRRRIYAILSRNDEYLTVPVEQQAAHIKKVPGVETVIVVDAKHSIESAKDTFISALEEIFRESCGA